MIFIFPHRTPIITTQLKNKHRNKFEPSSLPNPPLFPVEAHVVRCRYGISMRAQVCYIMRRQVHLSHPGAPLTIEGVGGGLVEGEGWPDAPFTARDKCRHSKRMDLNERVVRRLHQNRRRLRRAFEGWVRGGVRRWSAAAGHACLSGLLHRNNWFRNSSSRRIKRGLCVSGTVQWLIK